MTIQEFRDNINSWDALFIFCGDNNLECFTDDIFQSEDIEELIQNRIEREGWKGVCNLLSGIIDSNDDYYQIDGYSDLQTLTSSDFDARKDEIEEAFEDFEDAEKNMKMDVH